MLNNVNLIFLGSRWIIDYE